MLIIWELVYNFVRNLRKKTTKKRDTREHNYKQQPNESWQVRK